MFRPRSDNHNGETKMLTDRLCFDMHGVALVSILRSMPGLTGRGRHEAVMP